MRREEWKYLHQPGEPKLSLAFKFNIDMFPQACKKINVSNRYLIELGSALKVAERFLTLLGLVHVEQNFFHSCHETVWEIGSITDELARKRDRLVNDPEAVAVLGKREIFLIIDRPGRHHSIQHPEKCIGVAATEN